MAELFTALLATLQFGAMLARQIPVVSLGFIKYSHEVMKVVCAWRRSMSFGLAFRVYSTSSASGRFRILKWPPGDNPQIHHMPATLESI